MVQVPQDHIQSFLSISHLLSSSVLANEEKPKLLNESEQQAAEMKERSVADREEIQDLKQRSVADREEIQDLKQRSVADRKEIQDLKQRSATDRERTDAEIQDLRCRYETLAKKIETLEKMK